MMFVVAGSNFLLNQEELLAIPEGAILTLAPEPENSFDSNAVAVYYGSQKIGYVPNTGLVCESCKLAFDRRSATCPSCGSFGPFIKGGTAWELVHKPEYDITRKRYACYLVESQLAGQKTFLKARLLVEEYDYNAKGRTTTF